MIFSTLVKDNFGLIIKIVSTPKLIPPKMFLLAIFFIVCNSSIFGVDSRLGLLMEANCHNFYMKITPIHFYEIKLRGKHILKDIET